MQDAGPAAPALAEALRRAVAAAPAAPARAAAEVWTVLWRLTELPPREAPAREGTHPAVAAALAHIEANLPRPLTVPDIAAAVGLSHNHLTRLFHAATGATVVAYLRRRRLERARHLLVHSTLSIAAVAAAVGVPDLQAFNKACRRELGASPRAVRAAGERHEAAQRLTRGARMVSSRRLSTSRSEVPVAALSRLPDGFAWGVATSAFQIEGAATEGGRGPSVWDAFTDTPGKIRDGHTARTACDHYHRYPEDVALMRDLGIDVYRFSISWPRVQPTGSGPANEAGLDFYDRLVDALLDAGVAPMATLFHWDLPQALEDNDAGAPGGWLDRDTAHRFAEYARLAADRLGDRVRHWITLNEPFEHMALGYALGQHAPGRTLLLDALPAAHHQLLGHGLATAALRAAGAPHVMLTNSYTPAVPFSGNESDLAAADAYDALHRGVFTDPVLLGRYPDLSAFGLGDTAEDPSALPFVRDGDLEAVAQPLDGLGVNYYNPTRLAAPSPETVFPFDIAEFDHAPTTDFGWPVIPSGLTQTLVDLTRDYGDALPPLWVTENGCSYDVAPGPDGAVDDRQRIDYLDAHVRAVADAVDQGADVRGYLVWSLLDNFEWAEGFHQRFGLVHVDGETRDRTPKASYHWYRSLIAAQA
nr:GH1 family beta-glucosidase [Glycomyces amatae]